MTTAVTTYTAEPDDRGWQHHSDGLLQLLLFVDSVAFDGHKGIGMGMDWIQDLSVLPRTRGQKFEITVPSGRERRECHLSGQSAREQSTIRTFVKELITSIIAILMIFIIIYAGVSMMVTLFVYPPYRSQLAMRIHHAGSEL